MTAIELSEKLSQLFSQAREAGIFVSAKDKSTLMIHGEESLSVELPVFPGAVHQGESVIKNVKEGDIICYVLAYGIVHIIKVCEIAIEPDGRCVSIRSNRSEHLFDYLVTDDTFGTIVFKDLDLAIKTSAKRSNKFFDEVEVVDYTK